MDFSNLPIAGKIPINRVTDFVAGFVPGAATVYIYYVANPSAFHGFLEQEFFGYRTKLCLGAAFCLVLGNTLTLFVNVLAMSLWGAYWGAMNSYRQASAEKAQRQPREQPEQQAQQTPQPQPPWREATWRGLATKFLKDSAPENTLPMADSDYNLQLAEIAKLPEGVRRERAQQLAGFKQKLDADDAAWRQWYAFVDDELKRLRSNDVSYALADGIRKNLQATGVYVIFSLLVVPALRNWMFLTFAFAWAWILVSLTYVAYLTATNPWATWTAQLEFLAERTLRREKAQKAGEKGD